MNEKVERLFQQHKNGMIKVTNDENIISSESPNSQSMHSDDSGVIEEILPIEISGIWKLSLVFYWFWPM